MVLILGIYTLRRKWWSFFEWNTRNGRKRNRQSNDRSLKPGFQYFSTVINIRFIATLRWKLKWAFLIACCPSVSVCKLFTFSFLLHFEPNPWVMAIQFCSTVMIAKIHWWHLIFFQNHWTIFNQTWYYKASLV